MATPGIAGHVYAKNEHTGEPAISLCNTAHSRQLDPDATEISQASTARSWRASFTERMLENADLPPDCGDRDPLSSPVVLSLSLPSHVRYSKRALGSFPERAKLQFSSCGAVDRAQVLPETMLLAGDTFPADLAADVRISNVIDFGRLSIVKEATCAPLMR